MLDPWVVRQLCPPLAHGHCDTQLDASLSVAPASLGGTNAERVTEQLVMGLWEYFPQYQHLQPKSAMNSVIQTYVSFPRVG